MARLLQQHFGEMEAMGMLNIDIGIDHAELTDTEFQELESKICEKHWLQGGRLFRLPTTQFAIVRAMSAQSSVYVVEHDLSYDSKYEWTNTSNCQECAHPSLSYCLERFRGIALDLLLLPLFMLDGEGEHQQFVTNIVMVSTCHAKLIFLEIANVRISALLTRQEYGVFNMHAMNHYGMQSQYLIEKSGDDAVNEFEVDAEIGSMALSMTVAPKYERPHFICIDSLEYPYSILKGSMRKPYLLQTKYANTWCWGKDHHVL